jgi:hypothetical protein
MSLMSSMAEAIWGVVWGVAEVVDISMRFAAGRRIKPNPHSRLKAGLRPNCK